MNLSKSINIKNKFKNINPITNASIDVKFLNNSNNFLLDCQIFWHNIKFIYKFPTFSTEPNYLTSKFLFIAWVFPYFSYSIILRF